MKVLVHIESYLMTRDINLDQRTDAPVLGGLVNRCIAAPFEALRAPTSTFTKAQQEHLGHIFKSMRPTCARRLRCWLVNAIRIRREILTPREHAHASI